MLNQQQREDYDRDGFVVIPDVISPQDSDLGTKFFVDAPPPVSSPV